MLLFGSMGSLFVINAIQSQPGQSLRTGGILIVFAFFFFVGLISKNQIVELIACGALLLGAGGLAAITVLSRNVLWGVGMVFFLLCIVVIQQKHRFVDQTHRPDDEMKNPYS